MVGILISRIEYTLKILFDYRQTNTFIITYRRSESLNLMKSRHWSHYIRCFYDWLNINDTIIWPSLYQHTQKVLAKVRIHGILKLMESDTNRTIDRNTPHTKKNIFLMTHIVGSQHIFRRGWGCPLTHGISRANETYR
jgi:hypothetical protein